MSTSDPSPAARTLLAAWGRIVLAGALVAAIMAVSGAFGSGALTIAARLAYWMTLVGVGAALAMAATRLAVPAAWLERRKWAAGVLITVLVAVPMTGVVSVTASLIAGHPWRLGFLLEVFPSVLATTAGITALAFLVRGRRSGETQAAAPGAGPAKFLARLPQNLQGSAIWAVEAQDHYLRVHTDRGRALILMRLSDAIDELEGVAGARTHRSWWVARDAVAAAERAEGRAILALPDGSTAPVSRAFARGLRQAGWF